MNAEEMLQLIGSRIEQLYEEPQMCVGDAGELHSVLFELHWLYAHATGSIEGFVQFYRSKSKDELLKRVELENSHRSLCEPGVAAEVIGRWRRFDESLGWTWPRN